MSKVRQVFICVTMLNICAGLAPVFGVQSVTPESARQAKAALSVAVRVAFRPQVAGLDDSIIQVVEEELCSNCGRRHSSDLSSLVKKEASIFCTGFRLSPGQVVCEDPQLPLENVASVTVFDGSRTVRATVEKRFIDQGALLLKLDAPLAEAPAAGIDPKAGSPVSAVCVTRRARDPRALQAEPAPLLARAVFGGEGESWVSVHPPAALLDAEARICGFTFNAEWQTNGVADPSRWPAYTLGELERLTSETLRTCERSVLPVTLSYRSPRMSRNGEANLRMRMGRGMGDDAGETDTELNTLGVLLSERRLFIRIGESKEKLVRLERIKVSFPEGTAEARFICALSSVQGIVAELVQPRPGPVLRVAADGGLRQGGLSFLAQVDVAGPGRLRVRATPIRVRSLETGWRDQLTTDLPVNEQGNLFVFSPEGTCLWWNAAIAAGADSIGEGDRSWRRDSDTQFMSASTLAALANPGASEIDAAVKPATAENESRLGWLGLDLQPMTRELAEAKKMMADTGGGKFGALVTRVYPQSPAAKAGVKEGWVLLSVSQPNRALPMKVELEESDSPYRSDFPWDRLDEVPAEYMERIPTPWPSAAGSFVQGLTKLGIGTKINATFIADGAKAEKPLEIALAPPTYENAPSYKWKEAGISVCDLTYEVRDYLGLAPVAPGVVVCRVESGGKAVTAGVRPFEVITQVNDQPVTSAKELEKLVAGAADVRLNVKRMTRDRVVAFSVAQKK